MEEGSGSVERPESSGGTRSLTTEGGRGRFLRSKKANRFQRDEAMVEVREREEVKMTVSLKR